MLCIHSQNSILIFILFQPWSHCVQNLILISAVVLSHRLCLSASDRKERRCDYCVDVLLSFDSSRRELSSAGLQIEFGALEVEI